MICSAEIDAVLSVLWYSHAIRCFYEDRALSRDEEVWKNNGHLFPKFSRYNSQKWEKIVGPDDPTVRGRKISTGAMAMARNDFAMSYREPVFFALELADRVRAAVATAIERKGGPSEDGEYEEEVARKAWEKIASDPSVREQLVKLARGWSNVDTSSVQIWTR
jgi:hypothetical protein